MTENRLRFDYTAYDDGTEAIYDRKKDKIYFDMQLSNIEELLNELNDENEQLKQFIQSLAEQSVNGKVMLRDGKVYDLNKILKKGDVE